MKYSNCNIHSKYNKNQFNNEMILNRIIIYDKINIY